MDALQRIDALRAELHAHNHKYYVLAEPSISDREFDALLEELAQLEAAHPEAYDPNSPTQRVGGDLTDKFEKVPHRHAMLSLSNSYNAEEVAQWAERVQTSLPGEEVEFAMELKYDGVAISLWYEEGALVRALTRGDGAVGEDVRTNVATIRTVPLKLLPGAPSELEIRGEIFFPWDAFNALNALRRESGEQEFANPRNTAAGTLKLQDSRLVAGRPLDCMLYNVDGGANSPSAWATSRSTPTILGMISPPFSTKTMSPMRKSNLAIWSALCKLACCTVVPPSCTGSRSATGVTAPVRPTWYFTSTNSVRARSVSNLYANAHRGLLAVFPSRFWWS